MNEANLQGELDGAVLALQERAALLDALNAKLASVADTLDAFEHELQARAPPDAPHFLCHQSEPSLLSPNLCCGCALTGMRWRSSEGVSAENALSGFLVTLSQ